MTSLSERLALRAEELRRRLDPASLPFETTAEVEPLEGTIGQPRALEAIEFGLAIETFGYNLYVSGAPGSGRESTVRDYLERAAAGRPAPDDWIYVHNFDDPDRPRAIRLPAGRGCALRDDVEGFLDAVKEQHLRALRTEAVDEEQPAALAELANLRRGEQLGRYEVNVLVDNSDAAGVPVVIERNPTYYNLFKVKVDFAPDMDWSDDHVANYAAFVSRCVRTAELRHFDRSAVARIVEHGARLREHQGKLSARLLEIADVVAEASFWAGKAGREVVTAEDVDTAIARKEYRSNLLEERIQELVAEGTLAIDLDGERVGQVNGLSLAELGDYRFGRPTRVTARVSLGRGTVESVEREIELSGPIHSKGFLILSGYLAEQYAQEWPLATAATIAFEQAYDEIEGDSASSTELYALLSALSRLPLRQGIAVTGSVDQHGNVQAVGGVTRKVEGFFAACKQRGLTGEQGVIVPAANIRHLMLADEVAEAVERGEFHLWAVRTIDDGIELLTGCPAGERGDMGYPEGSVHRLVQDRLSGYAARLRAFASSDGYGAGAASESGRR